MQYSAIIEWFYQQRETVLGEATRRFFDEVDTDVDPTLPTEEADHLQRLFHEWFLFDYRLEDGRTPLEFAADADGGRALGLTRSQRDDLGEAARTQVVAVFWVVGASAATHLVTLEDAGTGERYEVYDVASSGRLDGCDDGMIACRLVHVRDHWYMAGNPVMEFPLKPTERMKQVMRENAGREMRDASEGKASRFLDLIRLHYGRKPGRGEDAEGDDSAQLGTSQQVFEAMDEQALADFKRNLRERYNGYRSKYPALPEWWTVWDAVHDEDGRTSPMDIFGRLFGGENNGGENAGGGSGGNGLPFADEKECRDFVALFTDLWNVLPHRVLDGMSPNEMFAGRRRIEAYRHDHAHPRPWLDRLDMIADPTGYGFAFDAFPRVRPYEILGIERRDLEAFAKELAVGKSTDFAHMRDEFLGDLPHFYFEENALHAMLVGLVAKTPDEAICMLDAFLPHVDNRKVCECLKVPALRKDPAAAYRKLAEWIASDRVYTVRFAILTLMRDFKGGDFTLEQARLVAGVTLGDDASIIDPENDVKLAREWYFGVKLVESPETVIPLFEEHALPREIHNAALRRAIKSKRVDEALRGRLRGLIVREATSGSEATR
ncbi:DNA alkylation repair protein [Bifidobacterium avesanii]|nr:DNA alkylation repair protein [Bifidobacterium avesanii]